ncbi:MAG: AbrB/MazE/SpoVT family DNA-binding domain-containing protein [Limisphaerales bacterium]
MTKYLTKHGNSFALVIDRPILDLLKIQPDGLLEITTDGQKLTIQPARQEPRRTKKQQTNKTRS